MKEGEYYALLARTRAGCFDSPLDPGRGTQALLVSLLNLLHLPP